MRLPVALTFTCTAFQLLAQYGRNVDVADWLASFCLALGAPAAGAADGDGKQRRRAPKKKRKMKTVERGGDDGGGAAAAEGGQVRHAGRRCMTPDMPHLLRVRLESGCRCRAWRPPGRMA